MENKKLLNDNIQDTTMKIGKSNYYVDLYDTTEVKVSRGQIENSRILYFSKVYVYEKQNEKLEEKKNIKKEDIDYVAFEMVSSLKKRLLENPEMQEKFMSYVALYFFNQKKENRDRKEHYIGLMAPADEGHYINSISKKDREYFEAHLARIIKTHSNDEIEK